MNISKKNKFSPIGPVSSVLVYSTSGAAARGKPALAKGSFSSEDDNDKRLEWTPCKGQKPATVSGTVDEFFWIGSSIVAFSKWRLGYMGKIHSVESASCISNAIQDYIMITGTLIITEVLMT